MGTTSEKGCPSAAEAASLAVCRVAPRSPKAGRMKPRICKRNLSLARHHTTAQR